MNFCTALSDIAAICSGSYHHCIDHSAMSGQKLPYNTAAIL